MYADTIRCCQAARPPRAGGSTRRVPALRRTSSCASGGLGHVGGFANHGGLVRDPTTLLGSPAPQMPTFENRIPAPLAAPSQPPVINGPSARSPYGGVM